MKIQSFIVYIAAGVAFLAVSLWVFLSGGKSARAVRYKYKMGGIMLTAWSMLTAASCTGGPPVVTCYEPAPPEVMCYDVPVEADVVNVEVKDYGGNRLKPGDTLVFSIHYATVRQYRFRIHAGDAEAPVIQEFSCQIPEDHVGDFSFEQVLDPTGYRGDALISVSGVYKIESDPEQEYELNSLMINIVG